MSGSTGTQTGGAAINVAQLLSTLAPLFLGSGPKTATTTTGGTTSTAKDSGGTSTTSSFSTGDAGAIAGLQGIANTAGANSIDTSKTDALVADILRQSAQAFAPVIAQSSSAGLYNSSTLSLLSSEARARATSASSKAVLDYQTQQQGIQSNALANIVNATKNTTSTTTTPPTTRTVDTSPSTSSTVTLQAPTVDPLSSLLTLGGGILGNQLLKSKTLGDIPGDVGSFLKSNVLNPATDALGITQGATSLGSQSAILSPTTNAITGVQTGVDAIGGGAGLVSPALSVGENAFPTSTEALLASGGADFFTADAGALAASQGGELATFGNQVGTAGVDLAAGLGGDYATSYTADLASETALQGADSFLLDSGAGLGAEVGTSAFADAGASAIASAPSLAGGIAGFGTNELTGAIFEGVGVPQETSDTILPILGAIAALFAWIICTELKEQGKMSSSLYRYGQIKFNSYSPAIKYSYLLWAKPVRDRIRKKPSSFCTTVVATIFNLRVNNIAANMGCKHAKWTVRGAVISSFLYGVTYIISLLLMPLLYRSSRVRNYFTSTMES